jgi:DNA-binding NtrC family response regulator
MQRTLIIDDDPSAQRLLSQCFRKIGYESVPTDHATRALEILKQDTYFDLIVSDIKNPALDDFRILDDLATAYPRIPIIICSAYTHSSIVEMVAKRDVLFLQKPFTLEQLRQTIHHHPSPVV